MDCKSIQRSSSSSRTLKPAVFVSFRGEDIRYTFANHLFAAFRRKGIVAFKDDENIKQGEHISTKLVQAIEESRVLIVVFSKNYAASSWCLQELAKIVDCMNASKGQSVLPIFYDVSPSEVRKQSGDYEKAFTELEKRFEPHLVQQWRKALVHVANLCGWNVQKKPEHKEIEKIVERVIDILGYELRSWEGLVGMHSHVEQLEKLMDLDSNDNVRVVGICGMGGIGKSTLTRVVYDRNLHRYGATCFIDDVSKVYRDCGPIGTQKQLICQILNEENQEIWNICKATGLIQTRLRCVKTFIVLDNVDKDEQLEKLGVNHRCLCPGSRMIVISRDRHILDNYEVDEVYDAQLLDEDEARQLFCRKAFKSDYIMSCDDISREYEVLTDLAIKYVGCLPLAIEVLGSFLHGKNISEWRSALARLRDNPQKEVMDVLQISFDGLEPTEKEIFLDIACLFHGDLVEEDVERILNCCGFHPDIGMRALEDKSLIKRNIYAQYEEISMHHMLQELGKKIVRQEAPNEPEKWSRIWLKKDFHSIMFKKTAMNNVEAMRLIEADYAATFTTGALSRMNRLRCLIVADANFTGSLDSLSNELRYLKWRAYPWTYFPSSCEIIKLVELHLHHSSIKQLWEGIKPLHNLKVMNLMHSRDLVETPDFTDAPNLEELILEGCTKLVQIHSSIGFLKKLVYLNLKNCTSLTSLPNCVFGLSSLERANLRGCSKLFHSELLENAGHGISDTAILCQSTSSIFKRIKVLLPSPFFDSGRHDDIVGSVVHYVAHFYRLRELDLGFCNLFKIPDAIAKAQLHCLQELNLEGNNFVKLSFSKMELPRLIYLKLDQCKQLKPLGEFPLGTVLPKGRELVRWNEVVRLSVFDCPGWVEAESWSGIALSWMIRFLKAHKESSPCISIVFPGTQIPSCFNTQSAVNNSIAIEPFPNVHDDNWIGFAFCAAFVARRPDLPRVSWFSLHCEIGNGEFWHTCRPRIAEIKGTGGVAAELVHLCLLYMNRHEVNEAIHAVNKEAMQNKKGIDGFSFRLANYLVDLKVKKGGVRVVYKQDLEELNSEE